MSMKQINRYVTIVKKDRRLQLVLAIIIMAVILFSATQLYEAFGPGQRIGRGAPTYREVGDTPEPETTPEGETLELDIPGFEIFIPIMVIPVLIKLRRKEK